MIARELNNPEDRVNIRVAAYEEGVYLTVRSGDHRAGLLLQPGDAQALAAMLNAALLEAGPVHAVSKGFPPTVLCGTLGALRVSVVDGDVTCLLCIRARGRNDG